jgi:hypothetical protein
LESDSEERSLKKRIENREKIKHEGEGTLSLEAFDNQA